MLDFLTKHRATQVSVETNDVPSWEPWIPPYWGNKEKDLRYWDGKQCRFNRDWAVHYTDPDIEFVLILHPKFLTDGGSIPKWAWGVIAPFGKGILAWFVHDALYGCQYLPREQCDHIMLNLLDYVELGTRKQQEAYWAVRLAAGKAYTNSAERRDPTTDELISHVKVDSRTIVTPDYSRLYSEFYLVRLSDAYAAQFAAAPEITPAKEAVAIWTKYLKKTK